MTNEKIVKLETDILIIGGGAAGCYAGFIAKKENPTCEVIIAEKAHIKRSGCLGAGISAINAYLNPGVKPMDYVNYVKNDSEGLVREDLLYTMSKKFNSVANQLEAFGLPFLKDDKGNYLKKGERSVQINGERIKPILARVVEEKEVNIINRLNITNYIVQGNSVIGAFGFSVRDNKFYVIYAKAVICTTGGASGLYKSNFPDYRRHKMWYCPFNTGAGYAIGIRAGAEMTTFEMRFIALRTKNVIAPTGVLAVRFNGKQVNRSGESYQNKYKKNSTPYRLYATIQENLEGRGPCYIDVSHLSDFEFEELKKAYLNMSPDIVLEWANQTDQSKERRIEIEGTEPYLVGGHAQSGYWITTKRETSLRGLYAAGDVAGGAPKKYVTGCMVEGEIAVLAALKNIENKQLQYVSNEIIEKEYRRVYQPIRRKTGVTPQSIKDKLQNIMDLYAGGISVNYTLDEEKLLKAKQLLKQLDRESHKIKVSNYHDLLRTHEVMDLILVARVLIEHLLYRKETRWPAYQERRKYNHKDDKNWLKFINTVYDINSNKIDIKKRPYIKIGENYEHTY